MPSIIQNLIINNTADVGGGVFVWEPSGFDAGATLLVNNTIDNNLSTQGYGSALVGVDFGPGSEIVNNILVGLQSQNAFYCNSGNPLFMNNDVVSANGVPFIGNCSAIAGSPSNISLDPLFADSTSGNYYLQPGSPAIGVGSISAPGLPGLDFYGNPRGTAGSSACPVTVNMGITEFQPGSDVQGQCPQAPAMPPRLKLSVQFLGFHPTTEQSLSKPKSVTITNSRKNSEVDLVVASYGPFAADFLVGNLCPAQLAPGGKCTITEAFRPTSVGPESARLLIMDGSDARLGTVYLSGTGLSPGHP
jgi:hypothetical protein